jgi:hypothetical protein
VGEPDSLALARETEEADVNVSTAVALTVAKIPGIPKPHPYILTVGPGFVWFRVAKVGTRSILRMLDDGGIPVSDHDGLERRKYALGFYRRHYKFAFVRNPWDRLVSCWHNKVVDTGRYTERTSTDLSTFAGFVTWVATHDLATCGDEHLRLQTELVDLPALDFLGRFESFADDMATVGARLGLPVELRHENRSSAGDYREAYTPELRDVVGRLYAADVDAFGYSF